MNRDKVMEFLTHDDALRLLKVIDRLNPSTLPVNKLHTIKDVSVSMNMSLKQTWEMLNTAESCGLVIFYGGVLSRKKVDLSELGERFTECATPDDIKEVFDAIN